MYRLPTPLPDELVVSGKTYKRVGGRASVTRGVCSSNDGSWHYYFNKMVVDSQVTAIGNRRHFSVCNATGKRSVHISMKPQDASGVRLAKSDEIMIWYRFEDQWTGRTLEPAGWGRTRFNGKDAMRVAKAVDLLTAFLQAMTDKAEGRTATPVTPVLSPPLSTFSAVSVMEEEEAFQARRNNASEAQKKPQITAADSWEDEDWEQ